MAQVSGDSAFIDSCVEMDKTSQSPVASIEDIEACLNYIKQYRSDKSHSDFALVPPGKSAYDAIPCDLKKKANLSCSEHYSETYVPSDEELTKLITLFSDSHRYLDYFSILELHSKFPKKLKDLFSPDELVSRTFCSADKMGRIAREAIIKVYTDFRCRMSYDSLHSFSTKTEGFLTYNELCDFFEATLPDEEHKEKAVTTFTELILFRLDFYHKDQISIADLLATDILDRIFGGTNDDDLITLNNVINSGMSRLFFESLIDADKLRMHENADSGGIEEAEEE
ncbi:hypothetical protein FO519_004607 [Halicephalobus sp. NKZ332]|nr:hypothetical protein FO519_004607 [Halicephalobus sp. NKZ332]